MSENNHPTGRQIASARVLAGIGQAELAERARLSVPTLRRMEAAEGPAPGIRNNIAAVRAALEAAGVVFLDGGEASASGGPGVRLREGQVAGA